MTKYKSDFEEYLDRYAKAYSKPVEAARNEAIPQMVKSYYDEQETANTGKIQAQEGADNDG